MNRIPMSSPFYKAEVPKPPTYRRGDYGPPIYGQEYRETWRNGYWYKPDGSRAMSGFGGLGDMVLPELDMSTGANNPAKSLVATVSALGLGAATLAGIAAYFVWPKSKVGGGILGGIAAIAGVGAITGLVQTKLAADARAQWMNAT